MTCNVAGTGPLLRIPNRPILLPHDHTASQTSQDSPRSWLRQTCAETSHLLGTSSDASGPVLKRRRLDSAARSSDSNTDRARAICDSSKNPTNVKSEFSPSSLTDQTSGKAHARHRPVLPPRPVRRSGTGSLRQGRFQPTEASAKRLAAQAKPYNSDLPSSVTQFGQDRERNTPFLKENRFLTSCDFRHSRLFPLGGRSSGRRT